MKKKLADCILAAVLAVNMAFPAFALNWIQKDNGEWQCFNDNGSALSGWAEYNGNWYFMDNSSTMKTGWIKDNGSWYFLHDDGTMAHDTWIDNYFVNASGRWTKTR